MSLLVSLLTVSLFVAIIRRPLKALPWLFYLLAAVIAALAIYLTINPLPNQIIRALVYAVQKGHVGFSLFAIVMFLGVLDRSTKVRIFLQPVRAELSILAAIVMCGHFIPYLANYFSLAAGLLSLRLPLIASFICAFVLLALLVVLTITSIDTVKRHMKAENWRRLQALAYVFFVLIYLHLLGYLAIPAFGGSINAALNLGIYTLIFAGYGVGRLVKSQRELKDLTSKTPKEPQLT
jgi:DMSO/TMAO reductase YedYZ heme-binding membrane subunit